MLRRLAAVVCCASLTGPALLADPPAGSFPHPKTSCPDSTDSEISPKKTHYYLIRGDWQRLGRFDPDGNFVPYATGGSRPAGVITGDGPLKTVMVNATGRANSAVYEHRSGRLLHGTLLAFPSGVFVPELGSTVLDLKKDYDPAKADRAIYNLPEMMLRRSPVVTDPPKAGQASKWRLVPYREAYPKAPAEDGNPWFARVIGDTMELGHLSDAGEFVPDYGLPVFPYVRVKNPIATRFEGRSIYYTLPRPAADRWPSNQSDDDPEWVYEYRSGRLIRGVLQGTGNFVPELGSKVIDFAEYDPIRERRRIYNLPGVLRRVE